MRKNILLSVVGFVFAIVCCSIPLLIVSGVLAIALAAARAHLFILTVLLIVIALVVLILMRTPRSSGKVKSS